MKNKIIKNIKILIGGVIGTVLLYGIIATIQLIIETICNIIIK